MEIQLPVKKEQDAAVFWREYEARYGEKVLVSTLGRYIAGWDCYDLPFWGLLIATSGGFRVHAFPHEGWLEALSRVSSGGAPPGEKTIFIPQDCILSADLYAEHSWWKKFFFNRPPLLRIRYRNAAGAVMELTAETDAKGPQLLEALNVRGC
ncbi:MAG: hypothetical protein LBQ88_14840 [Treponema sp.]|jgi:hypothetical protein|nr:hypothetical protein [Treponema sp.]